jgi:hypothetical protein
MEAVSARAGGDTPWVLEALGVAWTIAAAVLVLLPALRPGVSLGPFDLLSRFGLTRQPGVHVHNAVQADQIQQFVPWTNLAWHQVHSGQLPLWNPYSVLGMPLAFNWQSSVFSVPTLVGYLFPVSYAYTAIVLTKLVIAGTGAYVLCRVLRLGPLAAAFGGTVFELSGPMIVHAGWPHTSVTCWAGWILVAVVGLLRGSHRVGNTTLLAGSIGLAVYGGHPESLVVMGVAVALFVVVCLVARGREARGLRLRPLRDLAIGTVCGFGLGAPLLFPGVQLGLSSARGSEPGAPSFPLTHGPNLLAVGLQGNDFRTAAYVGVVTLALAVVGARLSWHRPEVKALVVVALVTALLTFLSPVDHLLGLLPGAHTVAWSRSVMLLALALAVLAAVGVDALAREKRDRTAVLWTAGSFGVLGVVVLGLEVAAQLGLASAVERHQASLAWPAIQAVAGVGVAAIWWRSIRPGAPRATKARPGPAWGLLLFLALETGFLLGAGIPFWSVSSSYFPTNPGITALQRTAGSDLVGYGSCRSLRYLTGSAKQVGLWPNINVVYGIDELAVYDPILPTSYYREWLALSDQRTPPSLKQLGIFCARILTVAQARVFGVQYVLEPPGKRGPVGSVPVERVGVETLFSIPGSAPATLTPEPAGGAQLPTEAPGTPVPVTHPDPASWRLVVDGATANILRLRLTNAPGWHATLDGRPLALEPWASGVMLQAHVPPGRHVVVVHYWPNAFSAGIAVGAVTVMGFGVVGCAAVVLGRRRPRRPTPTS